MNFTKSQEAQADKSALHRLQKAHVDNSGFKDFFDRMQKADSAFSFISDHPADSDRVEMARQFPNKDVTPILTQAEWNVLKAHCSK
jgi:predicted Zn-dependent protease